MTSVTRKSGAKNHRPSILWFTLLCSLLGALWSLNLFPQGPMTYRIQTTVVLNSSRLEVLQEKLNSPAPSLDHPACVALRKLETKELASSASAQPLATRSESQLPDLHRVVLETEWNKRLDTEDIKSWLATFTEPTAKKLSNTPTARELRWIAYRLDLAKRYELADESRSTEETGNTVVAKTVGFSKETANAEKNSDAVSSTVMDVTSLQQRHRLLQSQLQAERFDLMGTVSITSLSKWNPHVAQDPLIAPLVGLLLGAFAGFGLAYLMKQKPIQSYATASTYESTLTELQIPLFHLGSRSSDSEVKNESASGKHLNWWISGCEWSLLFWGTSAAIRFAIDSNWRDLSVTQPLLALARLFTSV